MTGDFVPQPGSKWRPEEDAKLIELLAHGKNWSEIGDALPGRSERSYFAHYRQTLAHRVLNSRKTNEIIRTYIQ